MISVCTKRLSDAGWSHTAPPESDLPPSTDSLSTRTPSPRSLTSAIMVDSHLEQYGRSDGSLARSSLHLAQITLYRSIALCCHREGLTSKLAPQLIFDRFMFVQLTYQDIILGSTGH